MNEHAALRRRYRIRVGVFLAGVAAFLLLSSVVVRSVNTLRCLDAVERSRDGWQRPAEIMAALDLRQGSVVADIGSGAGYFSLALSDLVGPGGQVLAEDIRRLPLLFSWMRAVIQRRGNIRTVLGRDDDPRLPAASVDAVLVVNTYHEFGNASPMLDRIFQSLAPGGRLVVADRGFAANGASDLDHHVIPLARVREELTRKRFEILRTDEHFIDRPQERWWLLVSRKPG